MTKQQEKQAWNRALELVANGQVDAYIYIRDQVEPIIRSVYPDLVSAKYRNLNGEKIILMEFSNPVHTIEIGLHGTDPASILRDVARFLAD